MQDNLQKVYQWKLEGSLYLFRFIEGSRHFRGYHWYFDKEIRHHFINFLKLILEIDCDIKKTIPLTFPQNTFSVGINNWRFKTWKKLVIHSRNKDIFCLSEDEDVIHLLIGGEKLKEFALTIESVSFHEVLKTTQ